MSGMGAILRWMTGWEILFTEKHRKGWFSNSLLNSWIIRSIIIYFSHLLISIPSWELCFPKWTNFLGGIEWGTSIWFKFGIWNKWWLLQIFVWILLISSDWGPLCPMIFPILLVVNKKLVKIARFNLQVSQNHLLPLPRPQFQPIKFAMCPLILLQPQKCLAQQASFFLPTQTFFPTFSHSSPTFDMGMGQYL